VIRQFFVTPPFLNRFSTFFHHVVQNRKVCNLCAGRQCVTAENFEIGCFVYGINAKVGILRAMSHFRNFTGYWKIVNNSLNFEAIFEICSPYCSEIKDLQLLCRSTTRYSRKFRDRMLCLRHSTHSMRPIQNI
jgi:hypothetical protein